MRGSGRKLRPWMVHRVPSIGLGGRTDVFFHVLSSVPFRLGVLVPQRLGASRVLTWDLLRSTEYPAPSSGDSCPWASGPSTPWPSSPRPSRPMKAGTPARPSAWAPCRAGRRSCSAGAATVHPVVGQPPPRGGVGPARVPAVPGRLVGGRRRGAGRPDDLGSGAVGGVAGVARWLFRLASLPDPVRDGRAGVVAVVRGE